jgi:hypothetical protein
MKNIKVHDLVEFKNAYQDALLWSSIVTMENDDEDEETADEFEISDTLKEEIEQDCVDFLANAAESIKEAIECYPHYSWGQAGHDFALTRNHHGAGYWDHGIGDEGERLTIMAHEQGEAELYLGDDNLLYQL